MNPEQAITISAGGFALEGRMREGAGAVAAVVMHPHPQYGGDMDNLVVVALCDALARGGASTLRFNFRGAGRSEGAFDGGKGEEEDARAAIALMRARAPDAKVVLAGYSFGAMIASAVAAGAEPDGLLLVSPPVGMAKSAPLPSGMAILVVTGDQDSISPATAVRALAGPQVETLVVAGADHGWWPGVDAVASAAVTFAQKVCSDPK